MTEEQRTTINNLFRRYGNPSDEVELRHTFYAVRPGAINDLARVVGYDTNAARAIHEYQSMIEKLTVYRLALQERYNELATMPSVPVVRLERERSYRGGKVYYSLSTFRRLPDGAEIDKKSTRYPGPERRKALADYSEHVKAHPGITAELDIEKRPWER